MKNMIRLTTKRAGCLGAIALCAGLMSGRPLLASAASAAVEKPAEDPTYSNWINFTLGGIITNGNQAEFQRQNPNLNGPIFGGIDDMHLEQSIGKAVFTVDARAIFANSDYNIKLMLSMPDVGYISTGFTEFATYSNGNGGYLPDAKAPGGSLFFSGPEYTLYRGSIWVELGLRVPNIPELTLRYEHAFRNGQKDSTSWGGTNQTGIVATPNNSNVRKILPSFWGINESRDIFTFDARHLFGKPEQFGNTEVNLGMRYEFDMTSDQLNFNTYSAPSKAPIARNLTMEPGVANSYHMTNTSNVNLAIYDGHISSVTRFGDKLWMTAGFSYVAGDSDISGSRIAGPDYGMAYSPYYNNLQYANKSGAYIDLGGGSNTGASVAILNFMWMPLDCLTISPSFRIECANTTSSSTFLTEANQTVGPGPILISKATPKTATKAATPAVFNQVVKIPAGTVAAPTLVNSHVFLTGVSEGLQMRYTGIKNLLLYAQFDWEQQYESRGDVTPDGSYAPLPAGNIASKLNLSSNNQILTQKYAVGANWYALPGLNAAVQYYLLLQAFNQTIHTDDPVRVNQRLYAQNWYTNDVNARITWQPFSNLALVSRYDFQRTVIDSQWGLDGGADPFMAPYGMSSIMTNNMITESLTWQPFDRLYFQGSLSYVLNNISSQAAADVPAVTNSFNNYWTAGAGFGFAIDPKTELRGDFAFYSANNYINNAASGVPYGAAGTEYSFTASLNRQISKNVSLSVKYYMDSYQDRLSGGNSNFLGQMVTTNLQVKF